MTNRFENLPSNTEVLFKHSDGTIHKGVVSRCHSYEITASGIGAVCISPSDIMNILGHKQPKAEEVEAYFTNREDMHREAGRAMYSRIYANKARELFRNGGKRFVVSIAFDGVLNVPGGSVLTSIAWLKNLINDDIFHVSIISHRSKSFFGRRALKRWLRDNGLSRDEINRLSFPSTYQLCNIHIDGRSICFTGEYPTIDEILTFKPLSR